MVASRCKQEQLKIQGKKTTTPPFSLYFGSMESSCKCFGECWGDSLQKEDSSGLERKQQEPSMASKKTVVVTGASQGIGAAFVQAIFGEVQHVNDGAHVGRW
jgi:hypothetical protein